MQYRLALPSLPQTGNVGVGNGACGVDAAELKLPLLGYMVENTVLNRRCGRRWKRIRK